MEEILERRRDESSHGRTGGPVGRIADPLQQIGRQTDGHSLAFLASQVDESVHGATPLQETKGDNILLPACSMIVPCPSTMCRAFTLRSFVGPMHVG
jgi:hypothetical protein